MASNRSGDRRCRRSSNATTVQVLPRWTAMPMTKTRNQCDKQCDAHREILREATYAAVAGTIDLLTDCQ